MVQPKFNKLTQCQKFAGIQLRLLYLTWKVNGKIVGFIRLFYMYIQVFKQLLHCKNNHHMNMNYC